MWFHIYFILYFVTNLLPYLKPLHWKSDYLNYDELSGHELLVAWISTGLQSDLWPQSFTSSVIELWSLMVSSKFFFTLIKRVVLDHQFLPSGADQACSLYHGSILRFLLFLLLLAAGWTEIELLSHLSPFQQSSGYHFENCPVLSCPCGLSVWVANCSSSGILLGSSPSTETTYAGETIEQECPDWLEPTWRGSWNHRLVPCLRWWRSQDNHQGNRTDQSTGWGCWLNKGK